MSNKSLFIIFLGFTLLSLASSLSLSFSHETERCVYDLFYQNTFLILTYEFNRSTLNEEYIDSSNDTDLFEWNIQLENEKSNSDKNEEKIEPEIFRTYKTKGKIVHTIEKTDNYKICIKMLDKNLRKKRENVKMKIRLETSIDEFEADDKSIKMKDYNMVDDKVKYLIKKVEMINSMQKYQNKLEQEFSVSQISSNRLVSILSIFQILIICTIGILHMFSLRKILKNKV